VQSTAPRFRPSLAAALSAALATALAGAPLAAVPLHAQVRGPAAAPTLTGAPPIVIGHRGASGYRPEHTLEAYRVAIQQGASFIEPDLVLTKDGVAIARHEPLFGATAVNGVAVPPTNEYTTTNIFDRPEFASRLRTRTLDGTSITGFWSDDFTLAEVKTLRARERIPALRPGNVAFDDQFEIPTLQEVIDLAQRESLNTGRTIGIYPETKHPTFFLQNAANRTNSARFEDVVVDALHAAYGNSASAPVFLQSFEVANLQYLAPRTEIRLVQLLGGGSARPYDFVVTGDARTYGDLISPAGLQFVNDYAAGIGPTRDLLIPRPGNVLGAPTTAVADAHAAGLLVHPYTFRAENGFLSAGFRVGANPAALGDYVGETVLYLQLGVDGFFTDQPDLGVQAVSAVTAVNVVPEPSSVVLLATGGVALVVAGRRSRRSSVS
jgi:glycerophosphoryl diester phosphodiesterase